MKKEFDNCKIKHGGDLETAQEKYNLDSEKIIDFSSNINPLGPPSTVMQTLQKNLHLVSRYPDPLDRKLKKSIAEFYNILSSNLITGNGASELFYLFCHAIRPKKVLIPIPAFIEYEAAVKASNGTVLFYLLNERDDFKLLFDCLQPYLEKIDAIFLGNPNNPTGKLIPQGELLKLIACLEKTNTWLILDEAFIDFLEPQTALTVLKNNPFPSKLFVIRSLTKFYALPGIRLGFGYGSPDLIRFLEKRRDPWSVNVFAQLAGETALKERKYADQTRRLIVKERDYLFKSLQKIKNIMPFSGEANFLLVKILENTINADIMEKKLAVKGILIRNCVNFRGLDNNYFRIAVRSRSENSQLLKNITEVMEEK